MADWLEVGTACQIDRARARRYPTGAEIGQIPKCLAGEKLVERGEKLIVERIDLSVSPGLVWCRRREEPVLWPLPIDAVRAWVGRGPEKAHTGFAAAAVSADHLEEKS